jgi:hypothetical protein
MRTLRDDWNDILPPNPDDWTPEDIMLCTTEDFLSVEERIQRALAMYRFRLLSLQAIPVHNVVVVRFSASDHISPYLQSFLRAN